MVSGGPPAHPRHDHEQSSGPGAGLPGDKGNISHSLQTLEARGLIVIGRSPGGKAEALWLTSEGQKWASQLAGSCD